MTTKLRIGYVPLTDAALIHVAHGEGFAASHGLDLELIAETSWANIRDKLILGYFDAAHMLAPTAIASSLGIGHLQVDLTAPVTLGLNGNAITLSRPLFDEVRGVAGDAIASPHATARALRRIVHERNAKGQAPLTLAHVFPFSCHHYQLRLWMRAGGLDPDRDVRLVVLPPPFMVDSLRAGQVDGFCVGAPWNSLAVEAGVGAIIHSGTAIVRDCPEKVLAFRADWARNNAETVRTMADTIGEASRWASDPGNLGALGTLLADIAGAGVTARMIARIVGEEPQPTGSEISATGLRLDPTAIRPDRAQALWLYGQMVASGQVAYLPEMAIAAAAVYAPIAGETDEAEATMPRAFVGPEFDPDNLPAYVSALHDKPAPDD